MKKYWKIALCVLALCILAAALLYSRSGLLGWEAPELLSVSQQRRIAEEITLAVENCRELGDIDAKEERLLELGFATVASDGDYPAYLGNPEGLSDFWEAVCAGKPAEQTVFRVREDGELCHLFFIHGKQEDIFVSTIVGWEEQGEAYVRECDVLPIYDMELADWGIFYYQVYPGGDPHYVDYAQFRLTPANRELYDLNRKYILPVGYQMVNLFLCDWQEDSWGDLCLNDLLDSLYLAQTGQMLEWEQYPFQFEPSRAMIPAELFESTVLPCFNVSKEEFRSLCRYDAASDAYPWRPVYGNELTAWRYPMCEPEVVGCTENTDGTLTLDVQVYSPELKTNRLFSHVLTVRPLENGAFQYVSNRVTFVSDRGLPPNMARFELDGGWRE